MMQCKISKFKPDSIKAGRIIFIVGKRGCGKTTLLKDLLSRMTGQVDYALAMCPTMESAEMLRECMPASSVYDKYLPSKVDQIVKVAQHFMALGKKRKILLCLDDCLYDRNVLRSQAIREIFFNGRHMGITFVVLAQYCMDISPDLRTQIDYLFVMKENIVSNRQKLWKYLFGCVQNFDDFSAIMDRCTQNFECLCLDNTLNSGAVQECVFWYKASLDVEAFRLGAPVFFSLDRKARRPARDTAPQLPPHGNEIGAAGLLPAGNGLRPSGGGRRGGGLLVIKEEDDKKNGSDSDDAR